MISRLKGVKNSFKRVAFVGPNPHFFLLNNPYEDLQEFTFIENSKESVEKSYSIIEQLVADGGPLEQKGVPQPEKIEPKVMCEEKEWLEHFKEDQFDLIICNMSLHWNNDIETMFKNFLKTLEPDGAFISASLGGDTLQELRICMNLAEQERLGGISPATSPFLTLTELGNIFARCGYNLPTIDVEHAQLEFSGLIALLSFLSNVGEQGALRETKPGLRSIDTIVAAAALYETLFNKRTIG